MKDKKISDAVNSISGEYIKEAADYNGKPKMKLIKRYGSLAAMVALIAITCTCLWIGIGLPKNSVSPGTAAQGESHDVTPDKTKDGKEYALYTPRIQLPDVDENVMVDMIGCLVYKGHVYSQSQDYFDDDSSAVKDLVGQCIGNAKGTLNEWSTQKDFATEFASTYEGPVYTVKGYSEDFRLCVDLGEDIVFLDNFDGIGLTTGSDLFEERLHIRGNIEAVNYQLHSDWDNAVDVYRPLNGVSKDQVDKFIEVLCESPFEHIDYEKNQDFYSTENQTHLFLYMKDGTKVELRLMKGGYVGFQSLGWFFVKMPGEEFDTIFNSSTR